MLPETELLSLHLLVTGISLDLGLQPLSQGKKKVPNSDIHAPHIHLTVLQDLSPRQAKLTNTFTDLLEHLKDESSGLHMLNILHYHQHHHHHPTSFTSKEGWIWIDKRRNQLHDIIIITVI